MRRRQRFITQEIQTTFNTYQPVSNGLSIEEI